MAKPGVSWRDKLALWCLRVLTPRGIVANSVPLSVGFGPGSSTRDDPKLVIYFSYQWPSGKYLPIVSAVFERPEAAIDAMTEAVADIRAWAAEGEAVKHG